MCRVRRIKHPKGQEPKPMHDTPIGIIYHPKEVGSMVPIANSLVRHNTIKRIINRKGYSVLPIMPDHAELLLIEKHVGVGCFLMDGSNIILDEKRRERALLNFLKLVPELAGHFVFDPVGIQIPRDKIKVNIAQKI